MISTSNPAANLHSHGSLRVIFALERVVVAVVNSPFKSVIDIPVDSRRGPVNSIFVPFFHGIGNLSDV